VADGQRFFFLNMIPANVNGGSRKVNHLNWLELDGWDFSMDVHVDPNVAEGAPGKTTNTATFGFQIKHSGPAIFKNAVLGRPVPGVVVFEAERAGLQGAGGQTSSVVYLQLTFKQAVIASRTLSGDDGFKTEHVEMAFEEVDMVYKPIINGMLAANVTKSINIVSNKIV
jgi:type VI protein secretion system component Hcp